MSAACCICDADIGVDDPHVADGADAYCFACAHCCVECGAVGPVVATAGLCGACYYAARQRDHALWLVPTAIVGDESAVSAAQKAHVALSGELP